MHYSFFNSSLAFAYVNLVIDNQTDIDFDVAIRGINAFPGALPAEVKAVASL